MAVGDTPRQCWECQRRRWVCDLARPVCNKCRAAGIVCPGYDDRKPLMWLAPNRVTSRYRKKNPKHGKRNVTGPGAVEMSDSGVEVRPEASLQLSRIRDLNSGKSSVPSVAHSGSSTALVRLNSVPRSLSAYVPISADSSDLAEAAQYYNTSIYPGLVSSQLAPNPFYVPVVAVNHVPAALRHALLSMTLSHRILQHSFGKLSIPTTSSSSNRVSSWRPTPQLSLPGSNSIGAQSGPIDHISPSANSSALASLVEPPPVDVKGPIADMWMQLHQHTGLGIRALNEEINKESTRSSDVTIVSVLTFLAAELQQSVSPLWMPHAHGAMALVMLRGGFEKLMKSAVHLKSSLFFFIVVSVIANTTSPPTTQLAAGFHDNMAGIMTDLYSMGVYPRLPCPLPLFLIIVKINRVRHKLATHPSCPMATAAQKASAELVNQIDGFVPEAWARYHGTIRLPEWRLIACIFQSAVWLYCTATLPCASWLRSMPRFPRHPSAHHSTDAGSTDHRDRLFSLLREAMKSPVTSNAMTWPLVVAGVEAAAGSAKEQAFVDEQWLEMTRQTGASYPLVARDVLQRFWNSGKTRWDDCFDQPYAILS